MKSFLSERELLAVYLYQQVCLYRRPLEWLHPTLEHEALNTPQYEGIGEAVKHELEFLISSRRLVLTDRSGNAISVPADARLQNFQVRPFEAFVGFSKLGAAEWEQAALPRWDRYFTEESDERTMRVWAADKSIIEQLIRNRFGWFWQARTESIRWRQHRPWQATYWKVLESGVEAEFEFEHCQTESSLASPAEEECLAVAEWRQMNQWFRSAYELPGWTWPVKRGAE